jgi:hypothetical protein
MLRDGVPRELRGGKTRGPVEHEYEYGGKAGGSY